MAKVWKVLALLLVITVLVWLATLWRWQSAQVDPNSTQLAVHLALLPVVLTAALLGMVWGVKQLRSYAAQPTPVVNAANASKAAAGGAQAEAAATPAPKAAPTRLLGAAVQMRAGTDWSDAAARIASGECKFELDPQLQDDDGIAAFTARHEEIEVDDVAAALDELSAAAPGDDLAEAPSSEMLRALALLEATAGAMQDTIDAQWPALAMPLPPQHRAGTDTPALPPVVTIRVAIPARWPARAQQLAQAWLQQLFEPHIDSGLQAAGQSRAMAHGGRAAVQLHVHPVDSAEAFWQLMEQQLRQWERDRQPGLLWALVADSLVGETPVALLASRNELFSGRQQQGRVPGEAAAGLLLASADWRCPAETGEPLALVHRASLSRRDKSADAGGRITPQALLQAIGDTLQGTGVAPADIQHVTTDADQRSSRTAEVYEATLELLPHLDATEHALRLGLGCGDMGIARLAACAALTATQVQATQAPALVLGLHSPHDRVVVLMACATPPAPTAPVAPQRA